MSPPLHCPDLGRVVAVAVTYHIGSVFLKTVQTILAESDDLVLIDNGSNAETVAMLRAIDAAEPRVTLILNDQNIGLAAAQNQGFAKAIEMGADWILLLDHDSQPQHGFLNAMAAAFDKLKQDPSVAVLAPKLDHAPHDFPTRFLAADHPFSPCRKILQDRVLHPILFAIASGSLLHVGRLQDQIWQKADFFIDYIDVEFGLRLNSCGLTLAAVPTARLTHCLGEPETHILLGRSFKTTNHSPFRRGYIYRNRIRLWKAYGLKWPGWLMFDMAAAAVDILKIILFEKQAAAKIRAIFRAR
jgi:rhamnosyltransferase